jgi:hypothetical protein
MSTQINLSEWKMGEDGELHKVAKDSHAKQVDPLVIPQVESRAQRWRSWFRALRWRRACVWFSLWAFAWGLVLIVWSPFIASGYWATLAFGAWRALRRPRE